MTKQMKKLKKTYDRFYDIIWGNGSAVSGAIEITDILALLNAVDGVLRSEEKQRKMKKKNFNDLINLIVGLIVGVVCAFLLKIVFGLLF